MVKIRQRDREKSRTPRRVCCVCGTKIYADRKFCSEECRAEQSKRDKLARRPLQGSIKCAYCEKDIDVLTREPCKLKHDIYFCDNICSVAYAVQHNRFKAMSEIGNAQMFAYQEKTGKRYGHEYRAQITSKANTENGPRCKLRKRTGYVWGWLVEFEPNQEGTGYVASVPDLAQYGYGTIPCKTVKSGLTAWRARFIELRLQERQAGI